MSESAKGRGTRGGRRRGRGRERAPASAKAPAFVKREIPFYEFLGEEGLVKLEEQADWIIQEIGLEFRDDEQAHENENGAGDPQGHVDPGFVDRLGNFPRGSQDAETDDEANAGRYREALTEQFLQRILRH